MKLIDADELLKHKGNCYDENGHLLYAVGTGNIMRMPTIDAVPVVRRKDCRHYNHGELWGRSWDFCDYNENCCDLSVDPESDFCSRGERRTDETD